MSRKTPVARQVFEIDGAGNGVLRVFADGCEVRFESSDQDLVLDREGWAKLMALGEVIKIGNRRPVARKEPVE